MWGRCNMTKKLQGNEWGLIGVHRSFECNFMTQRTVLIYFFLFLAPLAMYVLEELKQAHFCL
jgi:hypothetical protein